VHHDVVATAKLSVSIRRPLDDVFAVLSDVTKTPRWSSAAVEEYATTPGPVGVGSRRHAVGRGYGMRTENDAEITEFEPGRRIALRSLSGPMSFLVEMDFAPVDGGTRVDWTWSFFPRGPLRVAGPLIAGIFRRQFAKDLRRLKAMMESGEL
jgi:uncharacterized membrane protein